MNEEKLKMRRRFRLFRIGLWMTGLSFLGMVLHYPIEKALYGVPDEYYPEYLWLFGVMPFSVLVALIGFAWGILDDEIFESEDT